MKPDEYVQQAARTICPQDKALERLNEGGTSMMQLLHSVLGLMGELGELAGAMERHLFYGRPFDDTNFKEELGDSEWYIAEACTAMGWSLEEILQRNIAKLRNRFPTKYTDELAWEENRDREMERKVLEGGYRQLLLNFEGGKSNAKKAAAEDDGPCYDECDCDLDPYTERGLAQIREEEPPTPDRYHCPGCRTLVNDERVKKMQAQPGLTFHCPECVTVLNLEDLLSA